MDSFLATIFKIGYSRGGDYSGLFYLDAFAPPFPFAFLSNLSRSLFPGIPTFELIYPCRIPLILTVFFMAFLSSSFLNNSIALIATFETAYF